MLRRVVRRIVAPAVAALLSSPSVAITTYLRTAVIVLTLVVSMSPAAAGYPITMDFSGIADLSSFGGSTSSVFDGSVSWNSTDLPTFVSPFTSDYVQANPVLRINGTNFAPFADPVPKIIVADVPLSDSFMLLFYFFGSPIPSGGSENIEYVEITFRGPSMFSSTALPGDLSFLTQTTSQTAFFHGPRFGSAAAPVSAQAAAVPDSAATLWLFATGLLVIWSWRRCARAPR
jgi:hypothetical protein